MLLPGKKIQKIQNFEFLIFVVLRFDLKNIGKILGCACGGSLGSAEYFISDMDYCTFCLVFP